MSDGAGPVPSFAARVAIQQQRSYAATSRAVPAEQFNGRNGGVVTCNPSPDYCLAVSSLVPMTSRRCPSPLFDGGVQQRGVDSNARAFQPPPSYGSHQSGITTTWNYRSPPTIVSSSTTTSPTSVDTALGVGTAAAGCVDGALRVKLLQLRLLQQQQQQQQQHLATRRGRVAATDSDDDGNHGYQTSTAHGRPACRRADVDGQRVRSQSAVGRRQIVVESFVASRPSSSTPTAMSVSTPVAGTGRGGAKAGVVPAAAATAETSFPNRRSILNFAPAQVGGLRSSPYAAPGLGQCRSVGDFRANTVNKAPMVPHYQTAQNEDPLRRASDESAAWLYFNQQQQQQPHQLHRNSPDFVFVDPCPLQTAGLSYSAVPSIAIDDVLYREAAEYVIAARPTTASSTGDAPWVVDEFLRSTNLNFVAAAGSRCNPPSTNPPPPQPSRRRRSDQSQPTMDADIHQQIDRRVAGPSSSSAVAAAVKRSVTLHHRPLQQVVRQAAGRGGSGGEATVSVASRPPHRWSADGDLEPHAHNFPASGHEQSQWQCGQQQQPCRDQIVSQPVTVGLWMGTATKTGVRRRVVATPAGSTSSVIVDGTWCSACSRHMTSLDQSSTADGRLYHNECLNCCICQRSLHNKPLYSAGGSIYCEGDYMYVGFQRNADVCSICCNVIVDTKLQAMGKSYHPECFQCTVCGISIDEMPFTVDIHSRIYCIPDYIRLYSPKCSVCCQAVVPRQNGEYTERLVALDRNFHPACFRCEDCDTRLVDGGRSICYPLDNRPFCGSCRARRIQNRSGSDVQSPSPQSLGHQHRNYHRHHDQLITVDANTTAFHRLLPEIYVDASRDDVTSSSPSFPIVDASIDDDQASWASSGCDVITAGRRQQPAQQHQQQQKLLQQRHPSGDTSSIASSIDREDDVGVFEVTSTCTRSSITVAATRSPLNVVDDRRTVRSTGNDVTNGDDASEVRRQSQMKRIGDEGRHRREDEEEDEEEEGPVARSDSAASSCGGGADSGHGSGTSDDTLTSSSDVETVDASTAASTPTTMTSVEFDDRIDDAEERLEPNHFTAEHVENESTSSVCESNVVASSSSSLDGVETGRTPRATKTSPSLDGVETGRTPRATKTSPCALKVSHSVSSRPRKNGAAPAASRQVDFLDLDSYRVTDL